MNYWEQRKKQLENQLEKDEKLLKSKLNKVYDTELSKLEKEIASYYQRYGVDNVIEYRTLLQKLPKEDVKLLIEKMDEFAQKYPQYKHLLPVRESIYKLNRLEGLQQSIVLQQYDIGAIEETALREHLTKYATLNANNTAEYLGFGKNFYFYNSSVISSLVNEKWCNDKNFSDRIWGNRQKLADFLNREFAQAIARGDSYERIMKTMRQKFDKVSRNDMFRLIYTEDTYIQAESSIRQFEEMGDEQYRISVVKDGRTCPICKEKAQKVYNIKDRTPGENFPPFHPWCRCTFTIEENEDHETWLNNLVEQRNEEKFEVLSNNQISELQKQSDLWYNDLTDDERGSIAYYTVDGFRDINIALREETGKYKSSIDCLHNALSSFNVNINFKAYRGCDIKEFEYLSQNPIGVFKDFKSISLKEEIANEFIDEIGYGGRKIIFYVRKNTKGAYIGHNSAYNLEHEFTLDKGAKYRVINKSDEFLEVEVWTEKQNT